MYCPSCGRPVSPGSTCACRFPAPGTGQWAPPPAPIAPPEPAFGPGSVARVAAWVRGFLLVSIGVAAVGIFADFDQLDLIARLNRGQFISQERIDASDSFTRILHVAGLPLMVVTGIAWMVWFRRIYASLRQRHPHKLRFSDGWTIGAWFVPFLNLVRPKQIVDDAWHATAAPGDPRPVPALVHWWWGTFLACGFVTRIAASLNGSAEDAEALTDATRVLILADVLYIAAAVLAVSVVARLTRRYRTEQHSSDAGDLSPVNGNLRPTG